MSPEGENVCGHCEAAQENLTVSEITFISIYSAIINSPMGSVAAVLLLHTIPNSFLVCLKKTTWVYSLPIGCKQCLCKVITGIE